MNLSPNLVEQTTFRGISWLQQGEFDFLSENRDKQWVHFRLLGVAIEGNTTFKFIKNMETGNMKWVASNAVDQLKTKRYEGAEKWTVESQWKEKRR